MQGTTLGALVANFQAPVIPSFKTVFPLFLPGTNMVVRYQTTVLAAGTTTLHVATWVGPRGTLPPGMA